jgi:hypothetical protein
MEIKPACSSELLRPYQEIGFPISPEILLRSKVEPAIPKNRGDVACKFVRPKRFNRKDQQNSPGSSLHSAFC